MDSSECNVLKNSVRVNPYNSVNNSCEMINTPHKNPSKISCEESINQDIPKENFNPEPLSEIADRTLKLTSFSSNTSSTPKNHKRHSGLSDNDMSNTSGFDYLPLSQRNPIQQDFSLSFLTNGFNQLGIGSSNERDSCNVTSDDDESFVEAVQSFTDLNDDITMVKNENSSIELNDDHHNSLDDLKVIKLENLENIENVQNQTFDQVDLESKGSDDLAPTVNEFESQETQPENEQVKPVLQNDQNLARAFFSTINDKTFDQVELDSKNSAEDSPQTEQVQPENQGDSIPENDQHVHEQINEVKIEETEISLHKNPPTDVDDVVIDPNIAEVAEEYPSLPVDDFSSLPPEEIAENPSNNAEEYPSLPESSEDTEEWMPRQTSPTSFVNKGGEVNPFSPSLNSGISCSTEEIFTNKVDNYLDVEFKVPSNPKNFSQSDLNDNEKFQNSSAVDFDNYRPSDFNYFEQAGAGARHSIIRDSVLLAFDPFANKIVPKPLLEVTEEVEFELLENSVKEEPVETSEVTFNNSHLSQHPNFSSGKKDEMSVIKDSHSEEKIDTNYLDNQQSAFKEEEYLEKMAELENKIKQEAEMREEALLKRISEKDKQITKMNGVVEAYEKAISELIAEKEHIISTYDKKCIDLKSDSELNANHLASLEATFSDLHAKYERTKQTAQELNEREKTLLNDRKTLNESLKMQEARYDKMKSHAMAQLEIANNTLAEMNKNHQAESTKLKALLKKEEIARASINEQLIQKSKENSELVKICDELINGTQTS